MSLFSEQHEQERNLQQQKQQMVEENSPLQLHYERQEEYIEAQRAAVEAIHVGRETLETTERQGEQLRNAENLAEVTEYTLDRANRLLRGMTWTGWFQNKLSRDVEPPEYKTERKVRTAEKQSFLLGPPKLYENVPESCQSAAQAVQNYHANLQVLEDCETDEQKETCKLICDNMFQQAQKEVQRIASSTTTTASSSSSAMQFASLLQIDLASLRQGQVALQQLQQCQTTSFSALHPSLAQTEGSNHNDPNRDILFEHSNSDKIGAPSPKPKSSQGSAVEQVAQRQDEHLDSMAKHLQELGSLASNINISMEKQSSSLESLDEKNDSMLFKSKMVTRRADRLLQNKAWIKDKQEFVQYASIQHQPSGKYLSVAPNNDTALVLSSNNKLTDRCIFGIWKKGGSNGKRTSRIFGLQNQYNKRWAGQSLLGQLACSASTFGRREEWDADEQEDKWTSKGTTLIVSSAGWGNGGYLLLSGDASGKDNSGSHGNLPTIGSGGLDDKKKAPMWVIQPFEKK